MKQKTGLSSYISIFVLLCFFIAAPAIVDAGAEKEVNPYGGSVVLPVLNPVEGFHPLIDRNVEAAVLPLIYNGLIKLNESLAPIPDLAESWTISDDGLTWDFMLRTGVLFHDGEELTSADVVYTLNDILESEGAYAISALFANIANVDAVDKFTVRVELRRPLAALLYLLTVEILPSHILQGKPEALDGFRKAPVGTGPFKVTPWEGDQITLSAFGEYFEGKPYLDSVVLYHVPDKKRAWTELMQGNLSWVPDLDPEDYDVIKQDDRFATYSYLDVFYHTILINNDDPTLSSRNVREALRMSIDIKELVGETLGGWGDSTSGPFVPGTWAYNPDITSGVLDIKGARELLTTEGWDDSDEDSILDKDGKPFRISLLIDEGDVLKEAIAKTIKWQLFRIGVQVDVEYMEARDMIQTRLFPGNYQTALLQFNGAGDPDTFISLFWHSSRIGTSNLARYRNDEVDRLIEAGTSEYDQEKRKEIYHDIHRIMVEDSASIFLFVRRIYAGATSRIEGLRAQPQRLFNSVREWKIRAQ